MMMKQESEDGDHLPAAADEDLPDILNQNNSSSQGRHQCLVCSRKFCRPSRLADHMAVHTGKKPYSCSQCGKLFSKKVNVAVHQRVHTGEKPYSCGECGVSYTQLGCLRRHRLTHAAEKPYCCSVCGRGYVQRRHLVQHERSHTGERPFCCPLCPKRFASRTGLAEHHKAHTGENLYPCSVCEKVFSTPSSFRDHVRLHTGRQPHPCSICGKSFNRPGLLRKHLQKHEEEKVREEEEAEEESRLHCSLCQQDFSSLEQLRQHRQLHLKPTKFVCEVCGREYGRASRLKEHARTHTGERPYECDICLKRFFVLRVFRKHQEIHTRSRTESGSDHEDSVLTREDSVVKVVFDPDGPLSGTVDGLKEKNRNHEEGERPSHTDEVKLYTCSVCERTYPTSSILREHCKIHEVDVPQTCSVCSKTFPNAAKLRSHQKVHMKEKPHACSICPRSFLKPCMLRHHMRIHIKEGVIPNPADQEFWLNMKIEEKKEEKMKKEAVIKQETGTSDTKDKVEGGREGEQGEVKGEAEQEGGKGGEQTRVGGGDASVLINSDGEEEVWRQTVIDPDGASNPPTDAMAVRKSRHCCPVCGRDCFKASALQKHLRIHSERFSFTHWTGDGSSSTDTECSSSIAGADKYIVESSADITILDLSEMNGVPGWWLDPDDHGSAQHPGFRLRHLLADPDTLQEP
ncbi:transmembrane protein 116 isoform 1-T1 [Pholidichthys leucotaenia]